MGGSNVTRLLHSSAVGSLFRSFLHDSPKPLGESSLRANYSTITCRCSPLRDLASSTPPLGPAYMVARDHYDVLGVRKNASASDVEKAYYRANADAERKLALKSHPDTTGVDADAESKFREVRGAAKAEGGSDRPFASLCSADVVDIGFNVSMLSVLASLIVLLLNLTCCVTVGIWRNIFSEK